MAATVTSAAVVFPASLNTLVDRGRNGVLFLHKVTSVTDCRNSPFSSSSAISKVFISCFPYRRRRRRSPYVKPFSPVMEWQDSTVKMEVDVPVSVAYICYSDREAIPRWMPFISSVKNLEDKPDISQWSLKYKAFGRDIEFSWLARNMQPIRNQKIHWRSLEGLPNRGAVRFFPKGDSSCVVEDWSSVGVLLDLVENSNKLTVSYEVPPLLIPVSSALQPFLESLLVRGLERFAKFAKTYTADSAS